MNVLSDFTNLYSLSKTLRFELRPIGKTLETIERSGLLEQDQHRAESYVKVKKIIDEYHKNFIEQALCDFSLQIENVGKKDSLNEFFFWYMNKNDNARKERLEEIQTNLRKQIAQCLKSFDAYKRIDKKELIKEDLISFVGDNTEEKALVEEFKDFTTYFTGFHENRQNMYSEEAKSTAIAYRLIHENLPKFIDNMAVFEKVSIVSELKVKLDKLFKDFEENLNVESIEAMFQLKYYNMVLTQKQIDVYNAIIGGRSEEQGKPKIQGLNEYLYNQQQSDKSKRLPKLKPLYKQILSDREAISWLPEAFKDANDVLVNVEKCYQELNERVLGSGKLDTLLANIGNYNLSKIYITNDLQLTDISQKMYGNWNVIGKAITEDIKSKNPQGKKENTEKYDEKIQKLVKATDSFSIAYLNECLHAAGDGEAKVESHYIDLGKDEAGNTIFSRIANAYKEVKDLLNTEYPKGKSLISDKANVEKLKNLLDAIKELQRYVKPLTGKGTEPDKDEHFYGELVSYWESLDAITALYNKVRNYVTQKPYSEEKIKLNFDRVQLVNNWPKLEQGFIMKKKDNSIFYLAIPINSSVIKEVQKKRNIDSDDIVDLMIYDQGKAGQMIQNLMYKNGKVVKVNGHKIHISNSETPSFKYAYPGEKELKEYNGVKKDSLLCVLMNDKEYSFVIDENGNINCDLEIDKCNYLPKEINEIRKKGSYNSGKNFNKEDAIKYIDYYKPLVSEYKNRQFLFKESCEYENFKSFTDDIDNQAYSLTFEEISFSYVNKLVDEGKIYLFQIYNKDFSPYSKGTPNMHTLYWKMLFDERNLANVVYKLNGQAEVFFRKRSIVYSDEKLQKGHHYEELKDKFTYPIIKDRRYSMDKFQFHVPITMNFKAVGQDNINAQVNEWIKQSNATHIIGIDRGERHLLYLSLIDNQGNVVKQMTLNEIVNVHNGNIYTTNYHDLLDEREKKRDAERKSWNSIESIKELKEGYLSQVVHKIAEMVVEYNAIVVLEDLNSGFMRGRQKVEKQVYQKFEKMLIDKLNYLVDKKKAPTDNGGLLNALQLTSKFESFQKLNKQSGILFYIPAWNTSKMDPTTGFVNLFDTRYTSVKDAQTFFDKFDSICYNAAKGWFEFALDYNKFTNKAEGTQTKWTLCTQGKRIETFRNAEKNSEWDSIEFDLTDKFKQVLAKQNIDISSDIKTQIISKDSKDFFVDLLHCLKLTLQMRNSITGTEIDYLISPVMNADGNFYDSRTCGNELPNNADANGAYNIARKGLWVVDQIKKTEDLKKLRLAITNKEWLQYAQTRPYLK